MGWLDLFSANASANYQNTNTNTNSNTNFNANQTGTTTGTQTGSQNNTGTYTPNLSDFWTNAYKQAQADVGPNGATPEQQTALDFINKQIKSGSVDAATATGNAGLTAANTNLGLTNNFLQQQIGNSSYTLGSLADKAAAGTPGYSSYAAPTPVSATGVTAQSTASQMPQYSQFYNDNLIDPSLKAYDYGTDRAYSALDARTAGGGGFANERSGLAYSDLGAQSALGRGQLYASAKNLGLTNAAGLATGDVNRNLTADTTNAANGINASEFNANLQNNRQQFDVGAAYQGDQMRQSSALAAASTALQQAGISQQILSNVITANGVDLNAAAQLFQSGSLTYSQLQALISAAQASNGSTTNSSGTSQQNSTGTSNTSTTGSSATTGSTNTNTAGGKADVGFKI